MCLRRMCDSLIEVKIHLWKKKKCANQFSKHQPRMEQVLHI